MLDSDLRALADVTSDLGEPAEELLVSMRDLCTDAIFAESDEGGGLLLVELLGQVEPAQRVTAPHRIAQAPLDQPFGA